MSVAKGLAQISQGFSQIGNAFEYQQDVERKKAEMKLREKEFEINAKWLRCISYPIKGFSKLHRE
jgi:hypothetical protein